MDPQYLVKMMGRWCAQLACHLKTSGAGTIFLFYCVQLRALYKSCGDRRLVTGTGLECSLEYLVKKLHLLLRGAIYCRLCVQTCRMAPAFDRPPRDQAALRCCPNQNPSTYLVRETAPSEIFHFSDLNLNLSSISPLGRWNVRTMLDINSRGGETRLQRRSALIALEVERFNFDIAALQETRKSGEESLTEVGGGYTFF